MDSLKKRMIAALLLWALLAALAMPMCYNLDKILSGTPETFRFNPQVIVPAVWSNARLRRLWLLLAALCGLFCAWAMVGSSWLRYDNKLYTVVPGITIPLPAGHGEHGTSWWMDGRKKGKVWTQAAVVPERLEELLSAGNTDYAEIQALRASGRLNAEAGKDGREEAT